mmetsp:Transcript_45516/g.67074  ORF Transcript_45516/g.67074 Transcript_45516/m.67074 type:complete len:257 (+) Transcript_45516:65-835(+)
MMARSFRKTQAIVAFFLFNAVSHSAAFNMGMKIKDGAGKQMANAKSSNDRRAFLSSAVQIGGLSSLAAMGPGMANAGIDPSTLKNIRVEGDEAGSATRLRQIELEKNRPEDTLNIPYEVLPSGVQYREYRDGKGEATVQPGSKVAVEMTIRCKSFSTAQEPGGLKYFTTKDDTDFNELAFTVGSGEMIPGLEEGMMGMKRNGLRRIEVPSTMVFAAKKANQLPLPSAKNKDGNRRFENLFKTDATLLFEVLVTRIK